MRTERTSNFELMRIAAILPIVAWHFLGQGGVMSVARPDTIFLGMGGRMAVNVFLILGCWFMTDTDCRPSRAFKLYLQVAFYSIPLTILMIFWGGGAIYATSSKGSFRSSAARCGSRRPTFRSSSFRRSCAAPLSCRIAN